LMVLLVLNPPAGGFRTKRTITGTLISRSSTTQKRSGFGNMILKGC
jgi:hypothetical protein